VTVKPVDIERTTQIGRVGGRGVGWGRRMYTQYAAAAGNYI